MTPAPGIEKDSGTTPPPAAPPAVVAPAGGEYSVLGPPSTTSSSSEFFSQNSQQVPDEKKTGNICCHASCDEQQKSSTGGPDEKTTGNTRYGHGCNEQQKSSAVDSCPLHPSVGCLLKQWRLYRNLSAEQVGQLAGMRRQQVTAVESGKCSPTIKTVEKIAAAMGLEYVPQFRPTIPLHHVPSRGELQQIERAGQCRLGLRHNHNAVYRRLYNFMELRRVLNENR